MALRPDSGRSVDSVVLAFLFGLFLFFSPFTFWWSAIARIWYLPYLLWLFLIVLIAWVVQRLHHDV